MNFDAKERILDDYYSIVKKNTEFFSTHNPAQLLACLEEFAHQTNAKIDVSNDKYKAKLSILTEEA